MEISLEHVQCDCGVQALSGEKLRREVCELKDTSDFFNVCTAKFAPAQLLLSSSLRIFEMTSDFGQNSHRNFFDGRLVASASRSAHSPVTSTCDTEFLCCAKRVGVPC